VRAEGTPAGDIPHVRAGEHSIQRADADLTGSRLTSSTARARTKPPSAVRSPQTTVKAAGGGRPHAWNEHRRQALGCGCASARPRHRPVHGGKALWSKGAMPRPDAAQAITCRTPPARSQCRFIKQATHAYRANLQTATTMFHVKHISRGLASSIIACIRQGAHKPHSLNGASSCGGRVRHLTPVSMRRRSCFGRLTPRDRDAFIALVL